MTIAIEKNSVSHYQRAESPESIHNAIAKAARLNPLMTEKAAPEKAVHRVRQSGQRPTRFGCRGTGQGHDRNIGSRRTAVAAGLIENWNSKMEDRPALRLVASKQCEAGSRWRRMGVRIAVSQERSEARQAPAKAVFVPFFFFRLRAAAGSATFVSTAAAGKIPAAAFTELDVLPCLSVITTPRGTCM